MELIIAPRFCGPKNSGNGGYTCGRIAAFFDGAVDVVLRAPPPLATALEVVREPGIVRLRLGATAIAEAMPVDLALTVPVPPGWDEASAAAAAFPGLIHHDFPHCFTCGTERKAGDGLRVATGPVAGRELVAATWIPDASLAGPDGRVRTEFLWAATDCAGAWAAGARSALLGRFAAQFRRRVDVGERCIVIGWPTGSVGRKHHAGTALFSADGELIGCGRQVWIEPRV